MKFGFIKIAAAVPTVKVGDCEFNLQQIEIIIAQAEGKGVEIIVFPELSLTGYSCQDLFRQHLLLDAAEESVMMLLDFTRQLDIISIIGMPVIVGDLLLNCAVVIQKGQILGIVPKTVIPNYGEFYEKRWFGSAKDIKPTEIRLAGNTVMVSPEPCLFRTCDDVLFGIEICEDLWAPVPPSNQLSLLGADLIFNLSASNDLIGKHDYLKSLISQQSARTITGYVYSGCGFGESTQDVVYGGNALIYENGKLLSEGERFSMKPQMSIMQVDVERLRAEKLARQEFKESTSTATIINCRSYTPRDFVLEREVDASPFIPKGEDMNSSCEEILNIQTFGLIKRLVHTGSKRVVIGVSGGLDSTLALLVSVRAFDQLELDRRGIIAVTMPGFGTTDLTYNNALLLMKNLGVTVREISIAKSVMLHFEDIGHDANVHDVTYENSQARERTQILMDLSNQVGGLVVGTGDLSELALGWATYNGDHMSMYGVNAGVPKTLIKYLIMNEIKQYEDDTIRNVLQSVIDTPISPELIPADEDGNIKQKTEDLVGPYELHDFFLYYFLRFGFRPLKLYVLAQKAFAGKFSDDVIKHWLQTFLRRFFNQQFKRSCLPDGPKVGSVSLSPRGDWRMPSDASNNLWLKEIENC